MGEALIRPHVLSDRDEIRLQIGAGDSLQTLADQVWPLAVQPQAVFTIDGDLIPRDQWAQVTPPPGAMVRGTLTFAGGGGRGKQVLGIIASIAVVIASAGAAAFILGPGASALAVSGLAAGLSILGNLALGALFKPAGLTPGGVTADPRESSVYAIGGQSNQASPYAPCLRVFGTHKVYPRLAAVPYVTNEGDNQFLNMLFDFGYGPLEVDDLNIGDSPLASFRDVDYRIHPSFKAGDPLLYYTADTTTEPVSVLLKAGAPEVRVTALDTTLITVDLVFPKGLVLYDDRGSRTAATVEFALAFRPAGSAAAWQPFGNFTHQFSRNDLFGTAYSNASKTTIVCSDYFSYLPADGFGGRQEANWHGYGLAANRSSFTIKAGAQLPVVGAKLIFADGQTLTVTAVAGRVVTTAPPLAKRIIVMKARLIKPGGTADLSVTLITPGALDRAITASTSEPLYLSVTVSVPAGEWEVRLTRNTADSTQQGRYDELFWSGLRSSQQRAPIAPATPHTIMELRIRANEQLSGTIQTLSGVCTAVLKAWNGTALVDSTANNPAWAFLDVLIGPANRRPLPLARIDLASIATWAAYCDATVTHDGYTEKRCMFDHVVDYNSTLFALLNSIASAGRATVTYIDGKIGVLVDAERFTPVQMFTPRNSWGFSAQRTYALDPHALKVNFTDPSQDWNQGQTVVYNTGYSAINATQFETLSLFGVTRETQAWRDGRYMLFQGLLRRENFQIEVDIENLVALRGDLVLVQHDVLKVGGDSSRIATVISPTQIEQYDPLPSLGVGPFGVRIRRADGTITAPIRATPQAGNRWLLTVSTAGLQAGDLITWGELNLETAEYLVKSITPNAALTATLALTEVARAIYQSDSGPIPPYVPPQSGRPEGVRPPPVTGLTFTQVDKALNRRPTADVYLHWKVPAKGNYAKYNIFERRPDGSLLAIGSATKDTFLIARDTDLIDGRFVTTVLTFGVQAVDYFGEVSDIVYADEKVRDPRSVPSDITLVSSNVQNKTTTITWRVPPDTGKLGDQVVRGYDVRWSSNVNATFNQATRVSELVSWDTHTITVPTRNGVYLVKALTASGVFSKNPGKTVIATEDLIRQDWYRNLVFSPGYAGRFVDTEIVDGELRLIRNADGTFPAQGFWIADYREIFNQRLVCRVSASIQSTFSAPNNAINSAHWEPISAAQPINNLAAAGDAASYDVRLWLAGSPVDGSVMADWVPLSSAIPLSSTGINLTDDSRPIIHGEYEAKALYFILELRSFNQYITPSVTFAGADIDFPEHQDAIDDLVIPAGGSRVIYAHPYVFPPTLAITLQSAAPGDHVIRQFPDQYGVDVLVRDGAGVSKSGLIDMLIWGVGRSL